MYVLCVDWGNRFRHISYCRYLVFSLSRILCVNKKYNDDIPYWVNINTVLREL